jgi:hypothetical protein
MIRELNEPLRVCEDLSFSFLVENLRCNSHASLTDCDTLCAIPSRQAVCIGSLRSNCARLAVT